MKAWHINFTRKTFVAGVKYRDDSLKCVLSILDAVQHVASRPGDDGRIWQVELDDKTLKVGDIYSHAKEVKFTHADISLSYINAFRLLAPVLGLRQRLLMFPRSHHTNNHAGLQYVTLFYPQSRAIQLPLFCLPTITPVLMVV